MGCAPFDCERLGKTLQGSTWARGKEGTLKAEEWTEYGYSRRRRSTMWTICDSLLKNNKGPYKTRYDVKKADAAVKHPEWTPECVTCKGTGKTKAGKDCSGCKGRGHGLMRCHLHGMLLASKLLLKNLWITWNPDLASEYFAGGGWK